MQRAVWWITHCCRTSTRSICCTTKCGILKGIKWMIDTSPYQHCECLRMGNRHSVCQSELSLEEQGKKVTLSPRRGEEAKAIVLDGCVFTDNDTKCDALYLFKGGSSLLLVGNPLFPCRFWSMLAHPINPMDGGRHWINAPSTNRFLGSQHLGLSQTLSLIKVRAKS